MSKAAVRLLLLVTLLMSLTACSGSGRTQSSGSASTLATEAPATENTAAVEQPLPAREDNPGIKAAPLPVGGNEDGGPCLRVSWSGDPIPEGVGAKITDVVFAPDTYEQSDNPCPSPPCIGHVLRAVETSCHLAIKPVDPSATGRNTDAPDNVTVKGYVLCLDEGGAPCKTFKEALSGQTGSLTVARPTVPQPPQDSGTGSGATTPSQVTSTSPGG